jgi:DNA primase
MGRIQDTVLNDILAKADVTAIIGRYTTLRKRGSSWLGLCPFHTEKSPSSNVNPQLGVWHCFGCQEGGGLIQFLMKAETLGFQDAVRKLGGELGIEIEVERHDDPTEIRRKRLLELLERTTVFYQQTLLRTREGLDYLDQRGIRAETIKRFRMGWAPNGGSGLLSQLMQAGYTPDEGVLCGVVREREGQYTDLLRGRIIFPITDPQDRVLAFGGRVLDDRQPKYLNTPETEFYSKRRQLYGLSLHRQAITKEGKAIVVEGYLDVVMMDQVGIELGVASLGTAFTPEQAALLRRYTHDAILAYDSDRAGQNATLKGIEIFEHEGLRAQVAVLPQGEDPDSMARKFGREGLETALASARSVIDYHLERSQERYDLTTPEGKEDFYREVLPAIEKIQNEVRQGGYVVKLAGMLGMTEERLNWRLRNRGQLTAVRPRPTNNDPSQPEIMLFRVCVHLPEGLAYIRQQLSPLALPEGRFRDLYSALLATEVVGRSLTLQDLLAHIEDEILAKDLTELLVDQPPETSLEDVERLVKSIRNKHAAVRLECLTREIVPAIHSGEINSDDERYQEYIRLKRQLKGTR